LGQIVVLSLEDLEKTKQYYALSDNVTQASYINEDFTQYTSAEIRNQTIPIRIMVAHSAFPHNNHFLTFECLSGFSDKDIEIICPLSYGKEEYRNEIIKKGEKLFGEKFTSFLELLPRDKYHNLLKSLTVYINHTEIQTSLYVIYFCVSIGIKIFVNQNNYNWMIHLGFKVNHTDELKDITFEELTKPLPNNWIKHNICLAKKILSAEERAKKWRKIYS
jgi:dTDP-N-acetylfucosamine:lipid II N-acetylfucosaminyltransferase